jgi:hypothetical protein
MKCILLSTTGGENMNLEGNAKRRLSEGFVYLRRLFRRVNQISEEALAESETIKPIRACVLLVLIL